MNFILYLIVVIGTILLKVFGIISAPWWLVTSLVWVPAVFIVITFVSFYNKGDWL